MLKPKSLLISSLLVAGLAMTACGADNNNTPGDTDVVGAVTPLATDVATVEVPDTTGDTGVPPTEAPLMTPTTETMSPTVEPPMAATMEATDQASGTDTDDTPGTTDSVGMGMAAASTTSLMDYTVQNSQGENLGEIEDLMVDVSNEEVRYAVLSFGGFLDIGEKLFAIPVNALTIDHQNEVVVFDVDEETLQNAPGFDNDNWPDTAAPEWDAPYRDYWQDRAVQPSDAEGTLQDEDVAQGDATKPEGTMQDEDVAQGDATNPDGMNQDEDLAEGDANNPDGTVQDEDVAQGDANTDGMTQDDNVVQGDTGTDGMTEDDMMAAGVIRASEMLGYNIENSAGDDVGEIEDIVVDLNSARVLYAVLSFGGFTDLGENFYAVPLRTLNFNHENETFVLDVDENMLQNAPSFSMDDWPNNINPTLGEEAREYWDNELSMQ